MITEDKESVPVPLTQSKYVLAKFGIQVIEPQADPLLETIIPAGLQPDNVHYHPGPRALECKADAGKLSCDRDSWMRVLWCYLFPCAFIESCMVYCCDCCWECLSAGLKRMEESYTFECCERCCKIRAN